MATRIESGQMQLRGAGGVPMTQVQGVPVEFVAARVQAQQSTVLAQTLDRLTSTLFEQAGESATNEAAQFTADNPPTQEQINLAKQGRTETLGRTGENITSSTSNIFDKALAKARSYQLSSAFESEAINDLLKMYKRVQSGTMSAEQVSADIKSVSKGYVTGLSKIDSDAALKFSAVIATHGNAVLRDAYRIEAERTLAQRQIKADADLSNLFELLEPTIKRGNFRLGDKEVPVSELVDVMRTKITNDAILEGLSPEKAQANLNKFEKAYKEAQINVLSEHVTDTKFAANPMSAIAKLDRGDAGRFTETWNAMSFLEKAKVRSNLRTVQIERQTTTELNDKARLEADASRSAQLQVEFFKTGNKGLLEELRAISIRSPSVIKPETVFELPDKLKKDVPPNESAEYTLKNEIIKGLHPDQDSVGRRAKQLGINYKQMNNSIVPFFLGRDDKDQNATEKRLRLEAKIVPGTTNIDQKQSAAFIALLKNFESEYSAQTKAAIKKGIAPPLRRDVEDQVIARRNTSTQTKAINTALDNLNKQYGVDGTLRKTGIIFTESTSPDDIAARAAALNLKPEDVNSIKESLRLINQKRQERDSQ